MLEFERFGCYMNCLDQRGAFLGLVNEGMWKEVNFVKTQAGQLRGGHFHTKTNEIIFLVSGRAEVELQSCDDSQQRQTFILNSGEGVQIKPYTLHSLYYLEDSEQVALLDVPFDPASPDLHTQMPDHQD